MHEVIISEKPKSAEKIAKALSSKAQKKKYGRKISYWEFEEDGKRTTVLSAVGHLYSLTSATSRDRLGFDLKWVPAYEVEKNSGYVRDYVYAIKKLSKDADKFVQQYEEEVSKENEDNSDAQNPLDDIESTDVNGSKKYMYKGFEVAGTIQIPKTNIKYPVLTKVSKKGLETSVCIQYGVGINQVGNTVIVGHNYRNGQFFSNNNKLTNGDSIYLTDNSGTKLKYVIYNKYETTPEDTEYMLRDTGGKREVSLSTCTNDSSKRIIIWAVAEDDK